MVDRFIQSVDTNGFYRMETEQKSTNVFSDNITNDIYDEELYRQQFNSEFNNKVLPVSITFGLTACFGFVANLLVVYIYGAKYKRCNFKYFLFVLGLIGLGQCTIMLPTQVAEMHYWFIFPTSWLCRVSAYVFGYTVIDCYFILLLIALDRFRKVCRPYDWQIQPNTARNLCIVVSVASLVFALPPGIISGHHRFVTSYNDVNITVTVCATDDIYIDRDWAVKFLLLFGGIPVSIVIVVTCGLYAVILKQFYSGPPFATKSFYNPTQAATERAANTRPDSAPFSKGTTADVAETKSTNSVNSNKLDVNRSKSIKLSQLRKVLSSILPNGDSIKSSSSTNGLRRGTKRAVRQKLLRKTLIVLIITVTCIIALIITFCLHLVAEEVNHNALGIASAVLNAFVIFHRGSFSIICAIFPIIYGIRDHKFRNALREMASMSRRSPGVITAGQNLSRSASRC